MMQLISLFQEGGYHITFASTASRSERSANLSILGIDEVSITLNDASFDTFISDLDPSGVLFDRYITEEQFGWRVAEQCPDAFRILDTEDLHFLRKARQEAILKGISLNLYSETAKRELASILRCDLSLLISEYEMQLLTRTLGLPEGNLYYLPFLIEHTSEAIQKTLPKFEERSDFVTIGNFLHKPNVDSVVYLKNEIWSHIRKKLPKTSLKVYGNYATQQIKELHDPENGFLIEGWAKEVDEVMKKARICLAPLRFGAGLKGKLLDAMCYGTPCVTTRVGAEGMHGDLPFSGVICDNSERFASEAVRLYSDEITWRDMQQKGFDIVAHRFQKHLFSEAFTTKLVKLQTHLTEHRRQHFLGQVLQHQTLQATRYLSKWIEEKNK